MTYLEKIREKGDDYCCHCFQILNTQDNVWTIDKFPDLPFCSKKCVKNYIDSRRVRHGK